MLYGWVSDSVIKKEQDSQVTGVRKGLAMTAVIYLLVGSFLVNLYISFFVAHIK